MLVPWATQLLHSRITGVCAHRGTPRSPHMRICGKGDLAGLQLPKTCLPLPWQSRSSTRGLKVCPHPVYTCSSLKAAYSPAAGGWRGEESPPSTHHPRQSSGDTGGPGEMAGSTSSHPQPRAGTWSRDTILHPHPHNSCPIWDPSSHSHGEITGTSAPWPKGWMGRGAAHGCTQDRTWMSPKPGQKQQAGGLLIASRGALVCLSILQETRFAALIPIWK